MTQPYEAGKRICFTRLARVQRTASGQQRSSAHLMVPPGVIATVLKDDGSDRLIIELSLASYEGASWLAPREAVSDHEPWSTIHHLVSPTLSRKEQP